MRAADKAARAEARKITAGLCELKRACDEYARSRQECATAGDYDKCMEIRLGAAERLFGVRTSADACETNGSLKPDFKPTLMLKAGRSEWPSRCLMIAHGIQPPGCFGKTKHAPGTMS
jgi:hypothetical protein